MKSQKEGLEDVGEVEELGPPQLFESALVLLAFLLGH